MKLQAMLEVHRHLDAEVEALTLQLTRLQGEQRAEREQSQAAADAERHLFTERQRFAAEIQAVRKDMAAQQQDARCKASQAAEAGERADRFQAQSSDLRKGLVTAHEQLKELQQESSAAELQADANARSLAKANAELQEDRDRHAQGLEAVKADSAAHVQRFQAEATALTTALEHARQLATDRGKSLESAEEALNIEQSRAQEGATRIGHLQSHVDELQAQLANNKEVSASLDSRLRTSIAEATRSQEDLGNMQAQLDKEGQHAAVLRTELEAARAENQKHPC